MLRNSEERAMPTRIAAATWEGGLKDGKGSFRGQTGLGGAYSFASRFESGEGSSPEELLAAAQAACFSMAFALGLERAGKPAQRIETKAACTIAKEGDGFKITRMGLEVSATVAGLDEATFQRLAHATKEQCPVSVALGGVEIQLEARLTKLAA
jgi:osmotically inducible protein OsmC